MPATAIELIMGHAVEDARDAPIGTFAGTTTADADRDTLTTYRSGVKRTRIASHRRLEKMLLNAGLDQATATANVRALHAGRVLVLVQSESALDDIATVIDEQRLRAAA